MRTVRGYGFAFDARATPRPAHEAPHDGPPLVLLEEEHHPTVGLVTEARRGAGYALAATVPAPALARRPRPALILLDLDRPHVGSVEVLVRHRSGRAHPVIATAASRACAATGARWRPTTS